MNGEQYAICMDLFTVHYYIQLIAVSDCTAYCPLYRLLLTLLLLIFHFRLQTDFFLCSFTFGFGRKIEL